ncbi:cobalt-precorrin 5A hydrolase [Enhydrobacter aerosaccus]|uniref:Cobalt-precorrin 5A hydrolase n=2 Tax=Enhydrobacter aerosaccus TaxID=225324 RepID=A0A1T4NXX5_9HYPH|nr:cobalt-precorrin 5A hydrolase [Enhydrobacter aerosaccus]
MIVAGVGCRTATSADEIEQVVRMALSVFKVSAGRLEALATEAGKAAEPAFVDAARRFGVPARGCTIDELGRVADRILTRSARVLEAKGVPSVAEACALVVAGENGCLLGARVSTPRATCALADGDGR